MGIPKVFRVDPEKVITSYSFTDMLTGQATAIYYACFLDNQTASSSGSLILFPTSITSAKNFTDTAGGTTGATWTTNIDKTFDIDIINRVSVKGMGSASVSWAHKTATGISRISGALCKVTKQGTQELLAQALGKIYQGGDDARTGLYFSVPQTIFSKGDKIRLIIQLQSHSCDAGNLLYFAHDPTNGADTTGRGGQGQIVNHDRTLLLYIPFNTQL